MKKIIIIILIALVVWLLLKATACPSYWWVDAMPSTSTSKENREYMIIFDHPFKVNILNKWIPIVCVAKKSIVY